MVVFILATRLPYHNGDFIKTLHSFLFKDTKEESNVIDIGSPTWSQVGDPEQVA